MFADAVAEGNKPTADCSGAWDLRYWKLQPTADYMRIAAPTGR